MAHRPHAGGRRCPGCGRVRTDARRGQGPGGAVRYGSFDAETLTRLRWIADVYRDEQEIKTLGQTIVYLGCVLLILGVFAMLYVRERRVWIWLAPRADGHSQASMALSSNRKTMEADQEFEVLKSQLLKVPS